MSLSEALAHVATFHRHIGAPLRDQPGLLTGQPDNAARLATQLLTLQLVATNQGVAEGDQVLLRAAMTLEELAEWLYAHARRDVVAAADSWGDGLYVWLGHAVAMGLPVDRIFAAIHQSNLTKEPGQLSRPGKAVKGARYRPPQLHEVFQSQDQGDNAPKAMAPY